jgi:hypothetical protein
MLEVADVFRRFGKKYLDKYQDRVPGSHLAAFKSIVSCQTHNLGGSVHHCCDCGYDHYVYHSCKNRSCPKCHTRETDQWVNRLCDKILPVPHFHIIFTLPSELRNIVRSNQKIMYSILMRSAFASLQKLAKDERFAGGKIGAVAVLHTWSSSMTYHPHVHFMVPAGAISDDESEWIKSNSKYFVPVKALSVIFRSIFMKAVRKEFPEEIFSQIIWNKPWGVFCKPFTTQGEKLIEYLGRYVHRIAITNRRIVSISDTHVTFKAKQKTTGVTGEEFIRRYLQHVLPKGFHKVRYFGMMHHANKLVFNRAKLLLNSKMELYRVEKKIDKEPSEFICPKCGSHKSSVTSLLPVRFNKRGPP